MKEAFPGFRERRSPDRPPFNDAQKREFRAVEIEQDKVRVALLKQQENRRPQNEYDERNRLLQEHARPVLKPDYVRSPRPDLDKQARINVTARYMDELKAAMQPFEQKKAAIIEAARNGNDGPTPPENFAHPPEKSGAQERLEPEIITDAYARHVEALTEQENLQPGPDPSPNPLSWPDERQALIDAAKSEMQHGTDRGHDLG